MHGGGNTRPEVNDQQWQNQIRLYEPKEGVYIAPRAPTDTWNLWHEPHIDALFDALIECGVLFDDVNPDRVYLMGYSAGGDGVYQLAPRTADRYAAAAMMAGHPNEAAPDGLRNLPFAIHMGEKDSGYGRNAAARAWGERLASLRGADPSGYTHVVKLHAGKGHWMDRDDAEAVPWMSGFTRSTRPERVVWRQDDVTHTRLYWLAIRAEDARAGGVVAARRAGNVFTIESSTTVDAVTLLLDDGLADLDLPVRVEWDGKVVHEGVVPRTKDAILASLRERPDPTFLPSARVLVQRPRAEPKPSFPASWAGVWRGEARLAGPKGTMIEFRMELHIGTEEKEGRRAWTIIYDGAQGRQERPYELVAKNPAAGEFAIDEKNGIVLEARLIEDVLVTAFDVQGTRILTRQQLVELDGEEVIEVEVWTVREDDAAETGGEAGPKVRTWPVRSVQKALLRRVKE